MSIDLNKAKNDIISELATNTEFHYVVRHILFKNGVTDNTQLVDDFKQEIFEKLLKKDAQQIYDWYCDNDKRVFAVGMGIAKKMFLTNPKYVGYNKHSFGEYMKFTSNLFDKIDMSVIYEDNTITPKWQDSGDCEDDYLENDDQHVIHTLITLLPDDDKVIMLNELDTSNMSGKYSKKYKAEKLRIFEDIKRIAIEKRIKIAL